MKFRIIILLVAVLTPLLLVSNSGGQSNNSTAAVPAYSKASEATFKGIVEEVRDRQCPMSGGMGTHLVLKVAGSTIEVHLATTKFVKSYDLVFKKGDAVQVVGTKVQFEGVETIFAREVIRGGDTFVFRDKDGAPVW
jgi:DNA/RNA endonuclease YhcR with UshA esterase domain